MCMHGLSLLTNGGDRFEVNALHRSNLALPLLSIVVDISIFKHRYVARRYFGRS